MMTRKRKRRGCWDVRLSRARHARAAARKRNAGTLLAWLLFALALLSISVADFSVTPASSTRKRKPVAAPPIAPDDGGPGRPASQYELGAPGTLRPRRRLELGRYGNRRPALARLLKDLRRPAARRDAADMLMARIPVGDAELREWVQEQLDDGSVSTLALWARPGLSEPDIFAHWKEAARRQAEEEAAALREFLTRTGGGGGGDGADGVSGGIRKP